MQDIFGSPYVTNLLLLAMSLLLFRIAKMLGDIHTLRRNSETALTILHETSSDRDELMRLLRFLVDEQAKARDKLHEIARLESTIIDRMPGTRR